MIRDDVRDLRGPRDAERSRLQQRPQRRLVLAEAELAEALHADRAGVRRLPGRERREGVARLGVALALVERRSEVPAAFVPVGAQADALAVERDRVVEPAGFARRGGRRRDGVEDAAGGRAAGAWASARRASARGRGGGHGWRPALAGAAGAAGSPAARGARPTGR